MTSSISSTSQDSIQLMMAQMFQKMNAADTDGTKGLSKDELLSIDTSGDIGGSAFLQSLEKQFDSLDADGNGELSSDEISSAKPPTGGPMGPPPGMSIESSDNSANSTSTTSTISSTDSTSSTQKESLVEELLEKLLASFAESYDKTTGASTDATQKVSSLISSADKDSSGSLSLNELSSLSTSSNSPEAGFVNDLAKNFKSYDTNGDGQLSQDEMKAAIPQKQYSAQELASMAETMSNSNDSANSLTSSLGSLSSSFIQKLLSNYQNSGLSNWVSSLSITS